MDYAILLRSPSFFLFLLQLDESIAAASRDRGCMHCGGRLDRSDWRRAGFGLPPGTDDTCLVRHSFICRECSRRTTPNSLRWMYYRWFSSSSQFLIPALSNRLSRAAMNKICIELGVRPGLVSKWQRWWQSEFLAGPFWVGYGRPTLRCAADRVDVLLMAFDALSLGIDDILRFLSCYRTPRLWHLFPKAVDHILGIK